ncbi:uncharacterized protein LOC117315613 [Pecten maximus]|uniref:uncharacterized protein LOC117315613 n=1 Tax=Pecten maximus TaxID=6579 RepID=UPI0014589ECD|nr:uncharacterized protein LOC117315613 [Pecten maximus]
MSGNSNGSGHSIDPDAVKENGFDPNETNRGLQPSYISPSYTNSLAGHQTDRTETLDSDQMRGVISSASPDILMHGLHTTDMVSTSLTDMNTQRGDTSGDRFRHNNDQLGIDEDRDKADMEKPGQNPDVNEANISETVLMSSSISAVFLLNMVCIVLLIANRRRRKRKREQKARQKANDRSTVSEYEVYQLACPYVTMSSGPYVSATSGPYVSTSTVPYISTVKMENSSSENVTSSSGNESGYSTLPETSTESVVDSQGFDSLRIPRPHVKKDVNNIFDDTDVTSSIATTSSVTSRKRSSTMTYTTAKDSDIKYWFCEIPRPIVSFSKLKLKQNVTWGTWPKSESNPYIDSVASSTGNHTYEEIMPSSTSDTSA